VAGASSPHRPPRGRRRAARVLVELDLLLANLLAHTLVLRHRLRVEANALDRDGLLVDDDPFLVQHDLVLLLAEVGPVHRLADVALGDGLTLEPDLLPGDGHRHVLLFGDDVLAQPGAPGLNLLGADMQLLFRARHRGVRVRPRRVVPGGAGVATGRAEIELALVLRTGEVVVPEQLSLLGGADGAVGLDPRCVLDEGLLVPDAQTVAVPLGVLEWHERLRRA
jgi:hypothetical protein